MVTRISKEGHTISRMFTHRPHDGNPPSTGLSPTIPNMVTNLPLVTHQYRDVHQPFHGCSPTIPRTVMQLSAIQRMVIHYPPSQERSPTIPRTVTQHLQKDHLSSPWWSPTIPRTVNHHPQDGHPPSPQWLPNKQQSILLKIIKFNETFASPPPLNCKDQT